MKLHRITFKFIAFIAILITILSITSCKHKKNDPDDEKIQYIEIEEVQTELNKLDQSIVMEDLDLIKKYNKDGFEDVNITWESKNPTYIDNEGKILRRNTKQITSVELQYTIDNGKNSEIGTVEVLLYPRTYEYVYNVFTRQIPKELSESIDYIDTTFEDDLYRVTWESSDTEVLTNDGIYIKKSVDTPVTITLTIYVSETIYQTFTYEIVVVGITDEEKLTYAQDWLNNDKMAETYLTSSIDLPTTDDQYGVNISWTTTDSDVVTVAGKVTRYVFDRYVELVAKLNVGECSASITYWVTVAALDTTNMSQVEILENYLKAIAKTSLSRLYFSAYTNITQSYNNLFFFDNEYQEEIEYIAPSGNENRPGTKKPSTEFIVVHDTASNPASATALAHAKYVTNGGGGTSFHYVVGNDGVYHLIPNDEVAYHAGDGTRYFELVDTGVKATTKYANVAISTDGYFTFNGVKSTIEIPSGANAYSHICSSGIYYEVGANGNYYMNKSYYNGTYYYIANYGGNRNSIGIETCVNQTTDYALTLRYNAKLVAKLLIDNNLSVNRVLQHNNMSGKPCPLAMRTASYWQVFRDQVSLQKFGYEHFSGLTFEWLPQTAILSNTGFIDTNISGYSSVSYQVIVKKGTEVLVDKTYTTLLQ